MFIFLGYSHYSLVSTYQSHYEQTMIYIHYHQQIAAEMEHNMQLLLIVSVVLVLLKVTCIK